MGRYWQPCTDNKECKVEDDKLECINKPSIATMKWCDCVTGWDLREGWCVNKTLKESQTSPEVYPFIFAQISKFQTQMDEK